MKEIKLTITALSPLAVGTKKPGSVSEAHEYVAGSVIRGTIAEKILQAQPNPQPGDDFYSLFVDNQAAIFRNAYPVTGKYRDFTNAVDEQDYEEKSLCAEQVLVLPTTALSSKIKPGFKYKLFEDEFQGNGVFDTLIDHLCAAEYNLPYDPTCPSGSGQVEAFSGFYSCDNSTESPRYIKHSVNKRLLTRVGINRQRATSQEDILYSIEVLNEKFPLQVKQKSPQWLPVKYRSSILLEDAKLAKLLTQFIDTNSHNFRLGGATSRGLGKVKIKANLEELNTDISQNIEQFNLKLEERRQEWGEVFGHDSPPNQSERTYFTINLLSDAILVNNWQRTTVLCTQMLQELTGVTDENLKLHTAYSNYSYTSGWNSAWGLNKDTELITTKGSVYLFSTSEPDKWYQPLTKLTHQGIGERTTEGFGQITVCHPFHLIFREEAV